MIVIDLSKQQALDVDPNAMQRINFTGNLEKAICNNFFNIEKTKENFSDFLQKIIVNLFFFNLISVQNDSVQNFKRKVF